MTTCADQNTFRGETLTCERGAGHNEGHSAKSGTIWWDTVTYRDEGMVITVDENEKVYRRGFRA